jgi:cytochrome c
MRRAAALLLLFAACHRENPAENVERGRQLTAQYGCNVCHAIPGIDGPQGSLAPSLAGVGSRATISNGVVPNTPENLAKFVQSPGSLNPASSMPGLNMPVADAEEIAKYLRTLR